MRVTTRAVYSHRYQHHPEADRFVAAYQQQVSTGRHRLPVRTFPVASARALEVGQSKAVNARFSVNSGHGPGFAGARRKPSRLGRGPARLCAHAGGGSRQRGSYSQSEFDSIAADLRGQFDALVGIANSRDATGNYLFAGYKTDTSPSSAISPVRYEGTRATVRCRCRPRAIFR